MINLFGQLLTLAEGESWAQGMKYIGLGLMLLVMAAVSIGEGLVCRAGVEGVSKNPEAASKIRSVMILGTALVETCAIYTLLLAFLVIFVD